MGDDLAAKREEERLMRAFTGAKSPRSFAPKPAAATSPAPAAVTQPAAAAPKSWAKPAPAVAKPAADVSVAVSSPASGSSAGIVVAARSPPGAAAAAPAPAAAAAAPAPVVVAAPAPAAAPSPAVAAPPGSGGGAAVTSTIPARPGPSFPKGKPAAVAVAATAPPTLKQGALETAQVAPTNLGGGSSNVYTSARIPTLRGRKDVQRGVQIWQGKMLEDESKLRLAQDGGYTGLEQLLQHNALDVRNLAKEAVLQLETAPESGDIGTFTAEKLSPLVKLYTSTDNILVRQLALWDLATMASVPESRKAIAEKLGLDVVAKLVSDPETELAAAATTLLGNLAQDDSFRDATFKEDALSKVLALGRERKDPKAICAVCFAIGNFSLDEAHARAVVQAGGLAWVLQQLSSGDPEILRTAWGAISTLAKYDFGRQEILNAGGLKSLVHILKTTKDDLTFQYSTQAAVNLCLDPVIAERFIQEGGLVALERVNDDAFDLLCTKHGLVKRATPSVYAVQLRVATTYRNIVKGNAKCRDLVRARKDSVAIVRSLARSDQEKIAVVAREALALLEDDADAKAREAAEAKAKADAAARATALLDARAKAEAEEARKKVAAEEEVRRLKLQLEEEERKKTQAAQEEARRKAAEAELARKKAADAAEEARRKAAADEEARRKQLAEEERRRKEEADARAAKLAADLEAERKRLEAERKEAYEKEKKAREEAEARARQLEEDRRKKEEELRMRLDKEDQERRDRWRREEEERRRADEEARRRTEDDMRKLEDMQRRLAEERRLLDDAKRAVELAPAQVIVKERVAALPVEPIEKKEEPKKKDEDLKKVDYKLDRIIADMLQRLDLSRYMSNFAHNEITYDQLFTLRDRDLRSMGIDAVGPRARILAAINELYADSLGQNGDVAMRRLISDLDSNDANVVLDALERLFIVAERSSENRNALIVLDLIAVLIALIRRTRYIEVQGGAVKILASLCQEARAQADVRNCKGIDPLVYLVNFESWKDDLETLAHVLLCVKRLTNDPENKRLLREHNFMPRVIHIIAKPDDPAVRALALDVLAIITVEDRANQEALFGTNMTLNYINSAFDSNDVEVKEAATRALGALAGLAYSPFQQLIWTVPFDIPNRLVRLATLDGEETLQAAATLALAYLAEDFPAHAEFVLDMGIVRRTVPLLRAKNQGARATAAAAIRVLSRGDRVRRSVASVANDSCIIGPLCELAAFSTNADARREAMGALFELSKDSKSIQKTVFASLGPKPLIAGLKSGPPVLQYYCAGIFYNVARSRPDVVHEMVTHGVEPLIRRFQQSTDFNIRLGADVLEELIAKQISPAPLESSALAS